MRSNAKSISLILNWDSFNLLFFWTIDCSLKFIDFDRSKEERNNKLSINNRKSQPFKPIERSANK